MTTLAGVYDVLRVVELPGRAPSEFEIVGTEFTVHYTYNEGSDDEWSLIWTKVDDVPDEGCYPG